MKTVLMLAILLAGTLSFAQGKIGHQFYGF
jgi:hypothetical protein